MGLVSDTPETDKLLSDQHHDCVLYDDAAEQLADLACKLERERDELRADQINHENLSMRYMDERDEAREDAKRATYNATQETLKVGAVKGAWIEACRERDEAREKAERYRRKTLSQDAELAEARALLATAKESLNAIHVEVGGWIATMMKGAK